MRARAHTDAKSKTFTPVEEVWPPASRRKKERKKEKNPADWMINHENWCG
jgi:hypothetical protein